MVGKPLIVIGVALLVASAAASSTASGKHATGLASPTTTTTTTTTVPSLTHVAVAVSDKSTSLGFLSEDQQLARLEQPRQSFKLHMLQRSVARKSPKSKGERSGTRRRSVSGSSTDAQKVGAPTISSATLIKLLSQVAKQANLTATTAPNDNSNKLPEQQPANGNKKTPYFKFVSIHKASNKQHGPAASPNSSLANTTSSLAASISKQLADSLLYSASSLLLDQATAASSSANSTLSLSSLASQLVAKAMTKAPATTESDDGRVIVGNMKASAKDNKSETDKNNKKTLGDEKGADVGLLDTIERLATTLGDQQQSSTTAKVSETESIKSPNAIYNIAGTKQPQHNRKKRPPGPSKIYNLPVQFVSNGQPSMVVFHTIRQHLASMKRLRTSMQELQPGTKKGSKGTKKGPLKLRTNSRLIYLPLRYLNNGKTSSVSFIKSPNVVSRGQNQATSTVTESTASTPATTRAT